ncbi:MAG TPA: OmpA family protein [Candidatus Krumholzibacteria bacterium]|nr:OmpA family protein [Candidatus Krumholzibacteria bacterium]
MCEARESGDARRRQRQRAAGAVVCLLAWTLLAALRPAAADQASLRRSLQTLEAEDAAVLAPATHEKAKQAVVAAESQKSTASLETAEKRLGELEEAMQRARNLWPKPLERRQQAKEARADSVAPTSWQTAENVLMAAARKLEAGRRDAAERQATSLLGLYDQTYREAMSVGLVGRTRQLLVAAEKGKAGEYAPRSYVRALDAVERTEKQIAAGEIGEATRAEADLARREAEHATWLLETIRESCEGDNRARMEALVLDWETQAQRDLEPFGLQGDFSRGLGPVLQQLQVEGDRVVRERNRLRIDLARRTDQADSLQRVITELKDHVRDFEGMVAELKPYREEANTVTAVRDMFTQSEGKVLVDDRDVVLRLHGLGFPSGSAKLPAESEPLLQKIVEAVRAFPGARLVVEGHTDGKGNADKNQRLSTERANAVRDWLLQHAAVTESRVTAVGRGSTQPVASNDSEDGRALNRRIDVIIARTH